MRALLEQPSAVLTIDASRDCLRGGCARRVESHLAKATRAGDRALVVLRQVQACSSDDLFDDVLAVVERFLDETPATQTTASGDVRKSLVGFVLIASRLARETCIQFERLGSGAPDALMRSGELENLWPRSSFSSTVNAAKRAFINRLGSDLAVICG